METERKIRTYGGYFEKFMETLNEKEQEKVQYGRKSTIWIASTQNTRKIIH